MNTIEDGASAAMREIAETVADVPALRLDPATLQLPQSAEARRADERALRTLPAAAKRAASADPRPAGARRYPAWLAPLTAAAVVVAIAVSLVVLKTHPNEAAVSPSAPISVPSGSVPRYFAELNPTGDRQNSPSGVLVGDTYTGKIVATIAPPAGLTFTSVSAASDDRTFVLFTTPSGTPATGRWYELQIAPGTAHPATLTRLPVRALPGVDAMAVSGSGRELAVVQSGPLVTQPDMLSIYSLATGRVLHSWSTPYGPRVLPYFGTNATGPLANWPTLTWVDGDRGIVYPGQSSPSASATSFTWKMRELDVAAKGGSLLADSRVVWTEQSANSGRAKYGCELDNPLGVSTDGRSFVCTSGTGRASVDRLMKWLVFGSGASPRGRLLYQTESDVGSGSSRYRDGQRANDVVLWTNQSGSTVIVLWNRFSDSGAAAGTHFGVISGGRYFPLPATLLTNATAWSQTSIAW